MQEKLNEKSHNLIMENRNKVVLSGVSDVGSFNEYEAVVFTNLGELKIKGKEIQIVSVDTNSGELILRGLVESLHYSNSKERVPNNFITKLFR